MMPKLSKKEAAKMTEAQKSRWSWFWGKLPEKYKFLIFALFFE
jgi:hypothetical protein